MTKDKDIVNVIRYFRPSEEDEYFSNIPRNLYGITVEYEINYKTETVKARWSVCSGDNFSRARGKKLVKKIPYLTEFPLACVEYFNGLNWALIERLQQLGYTPFATTNYSTVHRLFSNSLRKLKQGI